MDENALKHSIEVARTVRLWCRGRGDVRLAKRAGLLHDIEIRDHEMEGSHIQIGVDLCRKYKESQIVINAVGAIMGMWNQHL